MKLRIVKLLSFSALFFAIVFATATFGASNHANIAASNLGQKPASKGHSGTMLTGDPVGGGTPCGDSVGGGTPCGDPVGGGTPC